MGTNPNHIEEELAAQARWYSFLADCRTRVQELFHRRLDDYLTSDDLRACFERGDHPTRVVFQFMQRCEQAARKGKPACYWAANRHDLLIYLGKAIEVYHGSLTITPDRGGYRVEGMSDRIGEDGAPAGGLFPGG